MGRDALGQPTVLEAGKTYAVNLKVQGATGEYAIRGTTVTICEGA